MKSVLFILGLTLALCAVNIEKHQKIVNFVNKLRTTWKAKIYDRDYSKLIGTWRNRKALPKRKTVFKTSRNDLPDNYDLRDAYPNCETIKEIRDQSYCGACWAFSAAETMSDRLCIASGGELQTRVSAADIVTCCYYCGDGCFGGWPGSAFDYWIETGVPSGGLYGDTNSCVPYFFPPCDDHPHKCTDYHDTPECQTQCQDGYPKTIDEDRSYGSNDYSVSGEDDIMQEIYEMVQLQLLSMYMKILKIIQVVFINMLLVIISVDMQSKLLDGELMTKMLNIGLLLTHGMKDGEKTDISECSEEKMNVVLKMKLLLVLLHYKI